jgi:hypothetical protein
MVVGGGVGLLAKALILTLFLASGRGSMQVRGEVLVLKDAYCNTLRVSTVRMVFAGK